MRNQRVVYRIRNKENEFCYYGSTNNFSKRFKVHRKELENNNHRNKHLQNAWNKYGENNFVFEIVEEVLNKSALLEREQWYLDNIECKYNISTKAGGGNLGNEVNAKLKIINKIITNKPEARAKNSERQTGSGNPMFGRKRPDRSEMNRKRKGIFKHSEETKRKISESLKKRK